MGPRLFNIYLNDLPSVSKTLETALFADDSNFILSHKNPRILEEVINTELALIKDYYDSNGLSINTSKTTFLHISKKREKPTINIKLGDSDLKESSQISFLGVIIDNKLTFKGHFEKVYNKKKGLMG